MNFLEQLVAEWYSFNGFFVRTNVKFGRLKHGGWKGEMDVVAFHPQTCEFIHLEPSTDALKWSERAQRFCRKFSDARLYYDEVFPFTRKDCQQIAVVSYTRPKQSVSFGEGIAIKTIPQFIAEISEGLRKKDPLREAVPEGYPLLRAIQLAVRYGKERPNLG